MEKRDMIFYFFLSLGPAANATADQNYCLQMVVDWCFAASCGGSLPESSPEFGIVSISFQNAHFKCK